MRSWTAAVLATLALAGLTMPAHAQDSPACEGPYASDQLVLDVQALERAVIARDENAAINASTKVTKNIPCVQQKLPLGFLGRVYRGVAGGYYVGGDKKTSEAWFRTALEIDRSFRYGLEDLPGDHPLRVVYASMLQAEEEEPQAVAGKAFAGDGEWYLDGRRIEGPVARTGRPHILQLDTEGTVRTWLIQGNAFPATVLEDGRNVAETDGKKRKRDRSKYKVDIHQMGQGAVLVDRSRPPEQIPLIVTGGGLLVGAIALSAGSAVSRQNFKNIRDDETRLRKSQQTTNRLALGALAAAALGAGSLTYGIVIDDNGNPIGGRIHVRF